MPDQRCFSNLSGTRYHEHFTLEKVFPKLIFEQARNVSHVQKYEIFQCAGKITTKISSVLEKFGVMAD